MANVAIMPEMTDAETAAFLDEPGHLLRIGTVDDDGQPLVVPIWFMRSADRLLFTPRARSAWLRHLRSNPRAGCTIDESGGVMRKVVARGEVTLVHDLGEDDAWRDIYRAITMRYVPEHWGESYLNDTHEEHQKYQNSQQGSSNGRRTCKGVQRNVARYPANQQRDLPC